MNYLSAHFTLEELIESDYAIRHGIDNIPNADVCASLELLAAGLERVRTVLAVPLYITSGYRCPKLNSALGGSVRSADTSDSRLMVLTQRRTRTGCQPEMPMTARWRCKCRFDRLRT